MLHLVGSQVPAAQTWTISMLFERPAHEVVAGNLHEHRYEGQIATARMRPVATGYRAYPDMMIELSLPIGREGWEASG